MKNVTEQLKFMTVEELEKEIRHHNALYWDKNKPEISDYDYDRLVERLKTLAPNSEVLKDMGPSSRFGREVVHQTPMLSLDKCYTDEDLKDWAGKFESDVVVMPKMDGIAASLRYDSDGRLFLGATRGSGISGDDITANIFTITDIPQKVPDKDIEVRGEIYMRLSVFDQYKEQFSNPRNLAAGAIKHKDPKRCANYRLSFVAYDLVNTSHKTEQEKLSHMLEVGFSLVEYKLYKKSDLRDGYEYFAEIRDKLDFEIDGVVFKSNNVKEQQRLGITAHHPRYAIAYKFQGDSGTTVLQQVEWSVARTGAITPVALINTVNLSGANVSRASLHNAGYIEKLNLTIGAEVVVTRRGGVIPNVEFVSKPGHTQVELPTKCPSCQSSAIQQGDFLYCSNPKECRGALIGAIAHYCSVVDIQGFGDRLLSDAFDKELLKTPPDLYELTLEKLLTLERVGKKLATKLIKNIDEHRSMNLAIFLRALGIDELGKHVSAILQERYETLDKVLKITVGELANIHTVGEIIAEHVVSGLKEKRQLIDQLLTHVSIEKPSTVLAQKGTLIGKSFVFTGKLLSFDRKTAQNKVKALGGDIPESVTKSLTYLVIGDGKEDQKSSKQIKAEKIVEEGGELKIISESEFLKMIE